MSTRELPNSLRYTLATAAIKRGLRRRKRVLFIIHAPETFSAIEPVVAEMRTRPDEFELVFVAIPRCYTSAAGGPYSGLETTHAFLDHKGLSPIAMAGASLDDLESLIRLAPDFIFRQAPWDNDIPAVFGTPMLSFAQLCYVPYGLGTLDKPFQQYNQPFHNACDFIFCESDYHYREFKAHRAMSVQGVRISGYPRFEQLLAEIGAGEAAWPLPAPDDVPRVIWAPHHTVDPTWLGFSTFVTHKDRMLAEARRGRVSILLRPHPALRERLTFTNTMSGAEYDAYLRAFADAGCSGVDTEREYIPRFAASDCLVTDGLSFFSDYMLTGKPIVRTRRADSSGMNSFTEWLCEACDTVDSGSELQAVLDSLGERRYDDRLLDARLERRTELVRLAEGASRRIVDTLAEA
jgi:hypothetical protein